jgi:hypothetical protein
MGTIVQALRENGRFRGFCVRNRCYLVSYMLQICGQSVWLGRETRPWGLVRAFDFVMC